MSKVALKNGGWFHVDLAICFEEATYWNGNNHISQATGSQWDHERLYWTSKQNWVLNRWSQWQGAEDVWEQISHEDAIAWLIAQEHFDDLDELPEEVRRDVQECIDQSEV